MNIKFDVKLGKNANDALALFSEAYWGEAMEQSSFFPVA
jgi:hypothetical protein